MSHFLNDFLTSTEKIMLSKRFMIMVLLMRGHSALHVKNTLFVSNSAVMGVSSWMKNASPTTKNALEVLSREKDWETFFDKVN
jgi:Trp operon repressor